MLLEQAAEQLYINAEEMWLQAGMVASDKPARIFLRFAAKNAADLHNFENEVEKLALISSVSPRLISRMETVYQIDFFGRQEALQEQMVNIGYSLKREGNLWRVFKTAKVDVFPIEIKQTSPMQVTPYSQPNSYGIQSSPYAAEKPKPFGSSQR